jgi:predicted GNAT family acetyltransferase
MTEITVEHDADRHRFFAAVGGKEAYLDYAVVDDRTLDFQRTFTPPELRGGGLASEIVRHALEYARARGIEVIPTCWFVRQALEKESGA